MAAAKKTETKEKGQYVGTGYPQWQHKGKPCTIVERRGTTGLYAKFDGDDALYLLHVSDVAVK